MRWSRTAAGSVVACFNAERSRRHSLSSSWCATYVTTKAIILLLLIKMRRQQGVCSPLRVSAERREGCGRVFRPRGYRAGCRGSCAANRLNVSRHTLTSPLGTQLSLLPSPSLLEMYLQTTRTALPTATATTLGEILYILYLYKTLQCFFNLRNLGGLCRCRWRFLSLEEEHSSHQLAKPARSCLLDMYYLLPAERQTVFTVEYYAQSSDPLLAMSQETWPLSALEINFLCYFMSGLGDWGGVENILL